MKINFEIENRLYLTNFSKSDFTFSDTLNLTINNATTIPSDIFNSLDFFDYILLGYCLTPYDHWDFCFSLLLF